MRTGIAFTVTQADRQALEALVANRNTPSKVVWRAKIILASANGCGTNEIMRRSGTSKTCVWRCQERFMTEGVAGLTRDKTRPPGTPPLPEALKQKMIAPRPPARRLPMPRTGARAQWRPRWASATPACSASGPSRA